MAAHNEAIRLNPEHAEAHISKGAVLSRLGRNEEALVAYNEAISINTQYALAHYNKGIVLSELRRPEEAVQPIMRQSISIRSMSSLTSIRG